jgi:thiamine biosynthesis lipoprotein
VGGELRARGARAPDRAWRVAIERPEVARRSVFAVVELRDASMATSGDYRNFYEQDGVRLSHLIDPRTGRPLAHALASVSVIHRDAVRADALATGLSVLGPEEGYALAERLGIAAYFIVREPGDGLRGFATTAFPPVEMRGDSGAGG